jgi:hypothetical protein
VDILSWVVGVTGTLSIALAFIGSKSLGEKGTFLGLLIAILIAFLAETEFESHQTPLNVAAAVIFVIALGYGFIYPGIMRRRHKPR